MIVGEFRRCNAWIFFRILELSEEVLLSISGSGSVVYLKPLGDAQYHERVLSFVKQLCCVIQSASKLIVDCEASKLSRSEAASLVLESKLLLARMSDDSVIIDAHIEYLKKGSIESKEAYLQVFDDAATKIKCDYHRLRTRSKVFQANRSLKSNDYLLTRGSNVQGDGAEKKSVTFSEVVLAK